MARRKVTEESVEDRILDIADASPYLRILVFAKNKKGKTRFAASAPKVLIIDVNEEGTRSARKDYPNAKVFRVSRWEDIAAIFWYLKRGNHDFESVAIDTLSAMQSLCITYILKQEADKDTSRDDTKMTKRDWGTLAELMKREILRFRNLPMHVIFTAQETSSGDADEGEDVTVHPKLSPGSRGEAMGAVDIIGRLYRVKTKKKVGKGKNRRVKVEWETRMLVGDHDVYETGSREYPIGPVIRNPTVPALITAAFGDDEEEEED